MEHEPDIAVIGAGAAGLMAAIWAGRSSSASAPASIVVVDGAKKLGAKILVAGGGRCNVTHFAVDENQYAGSSPHAIRKVLRRFDVPRTVEFFRQLGVELKKEDTGKLFPVTDDAQTVLSALFAALHEAGAELKHPWRARSIIKSNTGFVVEKEQESRPDPHDQADPHNQDGVDQRHRAQANAPRIAARRVIIAVGGKALPRTGSDGAGYDMVRALGHTVTERIIPALVPLVLEKNHWITELSGISAPVTIELHSGTGKKLRAFTNAMLCTHFGISGPASMDMSRYFTESRLEDRAASLRINWLPGQTIQRVDEALTTLGKISTSRWLMDHGLAERLAKAICSAADVDASAPGHSLTRQKRRVLVDTIISTPLPVTGDRGFTYAEVTAGGVPLSEVNLNTMESRICAGLYLCGEILDVDGRIGGFNFQWAWASGYVAGLSAADLSAK